MHLWAGVGDLGDPTQVTLSINAFCRFIKNELKTDLVNINGPQIVEMDPASEKYRYRIQPNRKSSLCPEKLLRVPGKIRPYSVEPSRRPVAFNHSQTASDPTDLNTGCG